MAGIADEDFAGYTTAQLAVRITHLRGVIARCGRDKNSADAIGAAVDRAVKIFNERPDCGGVMLAPVVGETKFGLTAEAGAVCDWFGLERAQIEGALPGDVIESVDVLEWREARKKATGAPQAAEVAPGSTNSPETATEPIEEPEDTSPPTTGTSASTGPSAPHDGATLGEPVVTWHAQIEMDKLGMTVEHMEAVLGELPDKITKSVVAEVVAKLAEGGAA